MFLEGGRGEGEEPRDDALEAPRLQPGSAGPLDVTRLSRAVLILLERFPVLLECYEFVIDRLHGSVRDAHDAVLENRLAEVQAELDAASRTGDRSVSAPSQNRVDRPTLAGRGQPFGELASPAPMMLCVVWFSDRGMCFVSHGSCRGDFGGFLREPCRIDPRRGKKREPREIPTGSRPPRVHASLARLRRAVRATADS